MNIQQNKNFHKNFNFKKLFVPLTTRRAIFWIIIIGFIVFGNGLFNSFVGDDRLQLVDNLFIRSISNIGTFFTGGTFYNGNPYQGQGVYYKPILSTYYSLVYTFFGLNAFAFHFFQLVLHIANACIVFLIFKKFFKIIPSFFLALVFMVHPMNSEAVFYIAAVQEPLFLFFGSLALLCLVKIRSGKTIFPVIILLFLSLLSKETGILFLIISIIYVYFYNRKYFKDLLFFSYAALLLYFLLRFHAIGKLYNPMVTPIDYLNFWERMINVPAMFLFYVKQFMFPLNLSVSYHWAYKQIAIDNFFIPLTIDIVVVILFLIIAFFLRKRELKSKFKTYTFFLLWFFLGIIIHMQIFPLDATMAERWFYFPAVGILGIIGALLSTIKLKINKKIATIIIFLIISLFSLRTFMRSFNWRGQFSIVNSDIKVSKDSFDLENALGYQLLLRGRLKEAKVHTERSIELFPTPINYSNLGVIYTRMAQYEKAKEAYENALRIGDYFFIYDNLANLSLAYGDPEENIKFIKDALKKYPQSANLWRCLAIMEYVYGSKENAKDAIMKAYQYDPDNEDIIIFYNRIMNGLPIDLDYSKSKMDGTFYYAD